MFTRILPVLVSVVPATGLLWLPLIVVRPNRIADGETYGLTALPGGAAAFVVLGAAMLCVLAMTVAADRRAIRRLVPAVNVIWAVVIGVLPWVLLYQGAAHFAGADAASELTRVSPGAGVWVALVAALAAWHEVMRGAGAGADASGQARVTRAAAIVALTATVAAVVLILASAPLARLSYFAEYAVRSERFGRELLRHIGLSGGAVAVATLIGVPAGMIAYRKRAIRDLILDITSTIQTVPSLAMFGLLIAPLAALSRAVPALRAIGVSGVGVTPALIALILYALLPVVRNTLTGLAVVPPEVRESGRAMGMTRARLFWMVEVPLALPVVLRGVRTAAVQAVGNTTVAGLIGAGGLGWFIFQGLGQAATDLVVLGVIPIVVLAIAVDRGFLVLQRLTDRAGSMAGAEGAEG